jgi:uncharacterized delta-60 repeat protein
MVRYSSGGIPDPTFGTAGIVQTNFLLNSVERIEGLLLQADGKIVAAGTIGTSTANFGVARYSITGGLDNTFSQDGFTMTPIQAESSALAVTLQQDGKIVAAGRSADNVNGTYNFAVARYLGGQDSATLCGQVTDSLGAPLPKTMITLGGVQNPPRLAITNPFGYYCFYDVPTANGYVVTVTHKNYHFAASPMTIDIQTDITNLNFVGTQ